MWLRNFRLDWTLAFIHCEASCSEVVQHGLKIIEVEVDIGCINYNIVQINKTIFSTQVSTDTLH